MPRNASDPGMSDLERGIELEMEEGPLEDRSEGELELGDYGEGETAEDAAGEEMEVEPDEELELPEDAAGYAERFYELSQREFESESEVDEAVGRIVDEMEREYFFGALKKLARKGLSAGTRALMRRATQFAKGLPAVQALKGITQLSRGNLKGMLGSLAKAGLSTALRAHPAGAAALSTLSALGFREAAAPAEDRRAWGNFVDVSREAFEYLAGNLDEKAANPVGATRLAGDALQSALQKARAHRPAGAVGGGRRRVRV
ncbi:MAG TPA: hypothetical protein VFX28_08040, partial [Methylomirabilota bacterium]|nr:hypothetical protein [Methylomirabilota bacterium]